ncbi:MAG: TIGR01548 family HAD-type hydrolase [Leptolyngbya sp. SIO4C1]|nr:TIGR01548 family HAD-type hydrolase [Leptolyngbya sp. SIO4C1]
MSAIALAIFDIDGVVRDVGGSYRRAVADTVEQFTQGQFRPDSQAIDRLKREGIWNNDWQASQELIYRYYEQQGIAREQLQLSYDEIVTFFQQRYRGPEKADSTQWTGYIAQEPLLMNAAYLDQLAQNGIPWAFFSGATRGSASYVLQYRMGLREPVLIAMEDAPGKPDPTGLLMAVAQLEAKWAVQSPVPVLYAGDTAADMHTVQQAQAQAGQRRWLGVGVLPPHAQVDATYAQTYADSLTAAGAVEVVAQISQLTAERIQTLLSAG